MPSASDVCVLIPCLNEEKSVGGVVADTLARLPGCRVLVVDNGSTDSTSRAASDAGAEVLVEERRGKAQAVLAALPRIEHELLIMVDGDGSYPAEGAARLLERQRQHQVDMLVGVRRVDDESSEAFRPLHQLGTTAFAEALRMVFGYRPKDVFSGLRLFSKRFYKNVPILSRGFELEMEITIQCIDKGFTMGEIDVPFRERSGGSASKLRTVRDGLRILRLLLVLFRDYKPFQFFGSISVAFFLAGLFAGWFPVFEYLTTGQIYRVPLAILAAGLMNLSLLTGLTGLMLESSLRHRREAWQVELRKFDSFQRSAPRHPSTLEVP